MAQNLPFATMRGFDILEWHPSYQSCQRYFLDHAQYEAATQALCALVNIRLPFQWRDNPVYTSTKSPQSSSQATPDWMRPAMTHGSRDRSSSPGVLTFVSLVPYIRRLVVTGFDADGILHGFFGDAWQAGIGPIRECERRNYLFAAKSGGWGNCKAQYDLNEEETVPFMQPLSNVVSEELNAAEKNWSSWLALEDWMVGPRAPRDESRSAVDRYNVDAVEADSSRRGR
ncbi:hypothetical protein K461DRAFT_273970 [Myriangium duriaei CBS 260.36]|uniref:Ilp is an apoptosis inhibitor n=1 Tax=Myriangium duriaei CBS 260.36 TaxID=1168546 RepID=A0A9P4JF75_9PEZI|nr:hypothetical protein K461DRAFT_273970 [Myriangium duriaei CBS 260.36]